MTRTGRPYTSSVVGVYWRTSATSSLATTAPGVTARSRPTSKAPGSVIDGIPPLWRTSRTKLRAPRARLMPPVSKARLRAAGLLIRKFVGAAALVTMVAANCACSAVVLLRLSPIAATIRFSVCAEAI
jgi:hypothetical protein